MLRYKTQTRLGLVALYDIQPGNRAGLFLQPWSPHGAINILVLPLLYHLGPKPPAGPMCITY